MLGKGPPAVAGVVFDGEKKPVHGTGKQSPLSFWMGSPRILLNAQRVASCLPGFLAIGMRVTEQADWSLLYITVEQKQVCYWTALLTRDGPHSNLSPDMRGTNSFVCSFSGAVRSRSPRPAESRNCGPFLSGVQSAKYVITVGVAQAAPVP